MTIARVAVIGAGVMGAGIAAHLASASVPVLLLDIVPPDLKENEKQDRAAPYFQTQILQNRMYKTIWFILELH